MQARYAAGDVALSELILARRDASATRMRYLGALRDVMQAWAGLKLP
jgi:outer membrane protein TolC